MFIRLWPLILGAFALGLDAYVLAGLLPGIAHTFGTTQSLAGLGVAVFTGAYAVSAPVLSTATARYPVPDTLLAGLGLFSLGNIITMIAPSLTVFLVARLVAGIGAGLYSPLASASAANMVETNYRGRALSAVLAGLSTGTALGVPIGLLIEDQLSWRWTIGLIVLMGAIAMIGVARHSRTFPTLQPTPWRERVAALRGYFPLATLSTTLWTGIASLGLYTYLAEVAAARGMQQNIHAFIWLWGLGGMAGALLVGRVIDRYMTSAMATFSLLTLLVLGFVLFGTTSFPIAGLGCFLWGLAGWASVAPQQHALVHHQPAHATATIAWNSSANYLGGAIGASCGSLALAGTLPVSWLPWGAVMVAMVAMAIHLAKLGRDRACPR